ncbi:MAG: YggS family pyridoxal phosphate-dependent enzyme [Ignavibacteriae bacterium]|nr:YggS family pyridoxal phosphate-dependent enzyme [Ignavibacteriota bacterium]MCB9215579.1 YggS family pyridoxal phosphate-dependent enzyme [Ignavibacteria bacterium]
MTLEEQIAERYRRVREQVSYACRRSGRDPAEVTIVGVTKTKPIEDIRRGINVGILDFGENYVQELVEKEGRLRGAEHDIRWHFIGHLQRNKVKSILPFVHLVHSVDSERLALEINKGGEKIGRKIPILLQVNTSGETSKFGCYPGGAIAIAERIFEMEFLDLQGLMTLASFTDDSEVVRPMFRLLKDTRNLIRERLGVELPHLSMGMTNDFDVAVEEGATIVRIGTAIFGERKSDERLV